MEAIRFSTAERAKCTVIERYQITCLLLKIAMDHRAHVINTKDEIAWSAAMLQLKQDLGALFAGLGARAEAEVWLSSLEKGLQEIIAKINGSEGTLTVSDSLDTMFIEYCRLKVLENEEPTEAQFQQLLVLGKRMLAVSHIKTDDCHETALVWAKKLYSRDECTTICTDIQFRIQHLLENVQGRLPAAVTNLTDILRPRATNINEAAKNIEMIEAFIGRHPQITLPTALPGIRKQLEIRHILYSHVGGRRRLALDTDSKEARELQSALPTGWNLQRVAPNSEVEEETLKVKHILYKGSANDLEFDMMYGFFLEPEEVRARKLLRKLLAEESASGILTENAMAQIFGVEESNKSNVREELLRLNERELLQKLVGNLESPVRGAEWTKRRPFLKAWLLDTSRPRLPTRQCLWVDFHNLRRQVWSVRGMESRFQREFLSTHEINPDNFKDMLKAYSFGLGDETLENINSIEDRLELEEAKLGYSSMHYEKESFLVEGSIPQLCLLFFFCSNVSNEEPNEVCVAALEYAEEVARRQLTNWKGEENYQMIAQSAIMIATITQYRIESRIIKETTTINRALEEALQLLEETESLFGTTLYEVDLNHSLVTLETKVYMGSKMRIWTAGQTAVRLLFHAIQMIDDQAEDSNSEQSRKSREEKLLNLWQWVQRVKARTLAQSMDLNNMVPDAMLAGIQNSINNERADTKSALAASVNEIGQGNEAELTKALESITLEELSAPPLNLLPGVRRILKEGKVVISEGNVTPGDAYPPEMSSKIILEGIDSMMQDLILAKTTAGKIKGVSGMENESKEILQETLLEVNERIARRLALARLVTIADILNREEALVEEIEVGPASDRFQRRIELQRLRKEMREQPVLQRMLRIREGWPLSSEDLHKIAAARNGKVAFVDWFRVTSSFNQSDKVYMIIWRNGVCKLIDLKTELKKQGQEIAAFLAWENRDVYLPDVYRTRLEKMDWERFVPQNVNVDEDDVRPVESCFELVRPLFDDPLIEAEDLLVLSVTEGFRNFPLHAVEDDEKGPLILHHPVVYIPSLSVLHKCFWARYASSETLAKLNTKLCSLILGGIDSGEDAYQYGGRAVERIGTLLNSPSTTFIGPAATLSNFNTHISNSGLVHIHLHTNYGAPEVDKPQHPLKPGFLSSDDPEDTTFTTSPLNQAIVFNSPAPPSSELSGRSILGLILSPGAHVNLVGCASGRQGKFNVPDQYLAFYNITDEVMGLVPAFLFAGAGSVTSTLWPIQDEHGAVFSCFLFGELMRVRGAVRGKGKGKGEGDGIGGWVDLAEVHRKAVLEMRRIYKQPSAWAGFVLSGYWKFRAG
jgi:hypothetical protein